MYNCKSVYRFLSASKVIGIILAYALCIMEKVAYINANIFLMK